MRKKKVSDFFYDSPFTKTQSEIDDFLEFLQDKYRKTNDFFYFSSFLELKLNYEKFHNSTVDTSKLENEITRVKSYLKGISRWGYFEIKIFSNLLFLFDNETIDYFYEKDIKSMAIVNQILYEKKISSFLINYIILCFERENLLTIPILLNKLDDITSISNTMYERNFYLFFRALFNLILGNKKYIDDIEFVILAFAKLGDKSLSMKFEAFKDTIFSAYKVSL